MIIQKTAFHIPKSCSSRVHTELQKYNLILLDNKIHCPTTWQFALQTDMFVLSHKTSTGKVVHVQAMKAYGRVELRLHSLLTSALDGSECSGYSADVLATLSPGKVLLVSTKQEAGWVPEPVCMLWTGKNLFPPLDCLASGIVYQLLYPGSHTQA